jgi:hypothetical protein
MAKGKVLTKDIALDFVTRGGRSWQLNDFTSINEDAALVLSEFSGHLCLNGLKTIPERTAQLLTSQKWDEQNIDFSSLEMNGLTVISDPVAEALGQNKWIGGLFLDGLKKISDSAALGISKYQGVQLSLNGIKEISPCAASALAKIKDYDGEESASLYLCGLEKISDQVAEALGKLKGTTLNLSGLKQVSETAAMSLAMARVQLVLTGLKSISDEVAQALSLHKGSSFVCEKLDLSGLKSLSDRSAKFLALNKKRVILSGRAQEVYEEAKAKVKTKKKS